MATTLLTGTFIRSGSIPASALSGGILSSSAQLPGGTISSSTQVNYTELQNKPTVIATASFVEYINVANKPSLVSSSEQVQLSSVTGTTFAASDFTFPQNVSIGGTVTAKEFYTQVVSSSIIYQSGSTKFGDSSDDVMSVTGSIGVSGSMFISSSGYVGIGTTSPLTTGGTALLTLGLNTTAVGLSVGTSNSDMMYTRRLSEGTYQLQTISTGTNEGNIHLQPYGGNVAIGTTSVSAKLTVNESARINGWAQVVGGNNSGLFISGAVTGDSPLVTNGALELGATSTRATITAFNRPSFSAYDMFFQTSTNIIFNTGNSDRLRIDSSGNVLIGNTSNYGVSETNTLQVKSNIVFAANNTGSSDNRNWLFAVNTSAPGNFDIIDSATNIAWPNNAYRLTLTNIGNVGIGTTSPQAKLHLYDTIQSLINLEVHSSGLSGQSWINLDRALAGKTIISEGALTGRIAFRGYDGTNYVTAAWITSATDGQVDINDMPGRLMFSTTADGQSTPTERMRITSAGNVGIGTTSPSNLLHLKTSTNPVIRLEGASDSGYVDYNGTRLQLSAGGGDMYLVAGNSEKVRITNTGNVGISTTTPYSLLQLKSYSETTGLSFFTPGYDSTKEWGTRIWKNDIGDGIPLQLDTQYLSTWHSSSRFDHGQDTSHPSLTTYGHTQLALNTGYVGIGTTNPSQKLHVIGNMLVQGTQGFNATSETATLYIGNSDSYIQAMYDGGLDFYQNNTFRMRIQSSTGNVGIGTTNPSTLLDVNGSSTFRGAMQQGSIYRYSTFNVISVAVDSTGWIKLATVATNAITKFFMRNGSNNSEEVIEFDVYATYVQAKNYVNITRQTYYQHVLEIRLTGTEGGNPTVYVRCRTSDFAPTFSWQVASAWYQPIPMIHNIEETPGSGPSFLLSGVGYFNSAPVASFTGSLGIGTISPTGILQTAGSGNQTVYFTHTDNVPGRTVTLRLGSDNATYINRSTFIQAIQGSGIDNYALAFGTTATTDASAQTRMYISTTGNVGIGTTSPGNFSGLTFGDSILDVKGIIQIRGDTTNNFAVLHFGGDTYRKATIITPVGTDTPYLAFGVVTGGSVSTATERMRIDSSGRLLVGFTTNQDGAAFQVDANSVSSTIYSSQIANSSTSTTAYNVMRFIQGAAGSATGMIGTGGSATANVGFQNTFVVGTQTSHALVFMTNDAERARFTTGGYFKASNDGTYIGSTSDQHEFCHTGTAANVYFESSHASTPNGLYIDFSTASPDNNTQYFFYAEDSTTARCIIYSDGDLVNHDGVYGQISDINLKQDIIDAPSQWNDIKAIQFRKYRMKTDVQVNPEAPYLLGVVAQELEQVSPGLVDEHPNDDGTTTKTVKSSILLMKAAVALQEAMSRIEVLEQEMRQLKGS